MTTDQKSKDTHRLTEVQQQTYEAIYAHPTVKNLEWDDLRSLLVTLADVNEGNNGELRVTLYGQTLKLSTLRQKKLATTSEVMVIRCYLNKLGETAETIRNVASLDRLVIIDKHDAKIYHGLLRGTVPQFIEHHEPNGSGVHSRLDTPQDSGEKGADWESYYDAIAATLRGADKILIFGSRDGQTSPMRQLLTEFHSYHHDVVEHIIGAYVVDINHQTDGQLLSKAREIIARFYNN